MFLLKRTEEAAVAYDTYLQAGSNHPNTLIAKYRTAQIFHEIGEWDNCLSVTAPMLENAPQGKLFSQLQFIVVVLIHGAAGSCIPWHGSVAAQLADGSVGVSLLYS